MLSRPLLPVLPVRAGSIKPVTQQHNTRLRARQTAAQALLGLKGLDQPRDIDSLAEGVPLHSYCCQCMCMAVPLPLIRANPASIPYRTMRGHHFYGLQVSQKFSTALSTQSMVTTVKTSKQQMPAMHSSSCMQPTAAFNSSKHATLTAPGRQQHRRHCTSCPVQLSTSKLLQQLQQPANRRKSRASCPLPQPHSLLYRQMQPAHKKHGAVSYS